MPRGSVRPASIGQHVPSRPGWLHVTQPPWQAALQHTPSTQKPDPHAALSLHEAPFGFGPQLPDTHNTPGAQSLWPAQVSAHALVETLHANGAQRVSGPGRQRPSPSQTWMPVTAEPSHVPAPHITPSAYFAQPPVPSHVPSRPHSAASDIGHWAGWRGICPLAAGAQVPTDPGTSQRWHVSPHVLAQQTPSMQ
jgi:hypothetical protein